MANNQLTTVLESLIEDSGTNTVVAGLNGYHRSSGTPASGLGWKLGLGAENSAGTDKTAAEIQGYLTTVTNGSEDGAFKLQVRVAGSLQDALTVTGGSNSATIGSNQTTVTLLNTTATTVNAFGAATTVNFGNASNAITYTFACNSSSAVLLGGATTLRTSSGTMALMTLSTNLTIGAATGTCTIQNATVALSGTTAFTVAAPTTISNTLSVTGNSTLGDASTDTITCTGRLLVRSVTDAGPMTATPGTQREIVYNTSDSKFYGCTVTHGTAATWVALN